MASAVQFAISDFGFEMQDSFNFKFPFFLPWSASLHRRNDDRGPFLQELPALGRYANDRAEPLTGVDVPFTDQEINECNDRSDRMLFKNSVGRQIAKILNRSLIGTGENLSHLFAAQLFAAAKNAGQHLQGNDRRISSGLICTS